MDTSFFLNTPVGPLTIVERDGALFEIRFSDCGQHTPSTALLERAAEELDAYFTGKRRAFSLPLRPQGTAFQQRVWSALMKIPYGETRCYAKIAAEIGSPRGARAVGMACHQNPIPILIPCHRVVGKDGSLTGYAGGLCTKRYLLTLEREA